MASFKEFGFVDFLDINRGRDHQYVRFKLANAAAAALAKASSSGITGLPEVSIFNVALVTGIQIGIQA